jgi:hypothetical protein
MSDNTYKFQDHYNLSPPELFLFIALDQTKRQLGFADLAAVATWLLGVNDVPVPGETHYRNAGNIRDVSVLSKRHHEKDENAAPNLDDEKLQHQGSQAYLHA